jgi:hypothetical protein
MDAQGVQVRIEGAKVRDTAGQPWRSFLLNLAMLPAWFVDELKRQGQMHISANSDSMRSHLGRLSTAVLNPEQRKTVARKTCRPICSDTHWLHKCVNRAGSRMKLLQPLVRAALRPHACTACACVAQKAQGPHRHGENSVAAARAVKSADTQGLQKWKNRKPEKLTKLG